ncbi:MAG TPA: DUF1583 domain-containing protein [Gemmataceae bacterium]|nr:DUF1583 domain-containing protein [Gemmataceae bacterium]
MAKDPGDRFQSAAEVATLLEGYLAHLRQPTTVLAPELLNSQAKTTPRLSALGAVKRFRPRSWWLVLVALTALASGLALRLAAGGGADGPPPEAKARFHQDLRTADLNNPNLRAVGEALRYEAAGVRVTLPAGEAVLPPSGLATNFTVRGDFEITVAYEILKADLPTTGYGVGVALYVAIDPDANDAVSLARRLLPDGKTVFMSDRLKPAGGKLTHKVNTKPSAAPAGQLRLRRVGPKVSFLVAEGDRPDFVTVDEVEFGAADVRWVQISGNTGQSKSGLDLRLLDLTVAAQELPGLVEVVPDQASPPLPGLPPEARGKGWLAAGVIVGLAITWA